MQPLMWIIIHPTVWLRKPVCSATPTSFCSCQPWNLIGYFTSQLSCLSEFIYLYTNETKRVDRGILTRTSNKLHARLLIRQEDEKPTANRHILADPAVLEDPWGTRVSKWAISAHVFQPEICMPSLPKPWGQWAWSNPLANKLKDCNHGFQQQPWDKLMRDDVVAQID